MKQLFLFLAAAIIIGFSSCRKVNGDGPIVTETRNITGFNGLAVSFASDVVYTQASTYKVELHAQQNVLEYIETNQVSGELRIRLKQNVRLRSFDRPVIYVSSPDIYSIAMSGSGNIDANTPINTDRMRLAISGSGNINIDSMNVVNNVESVISGSGSINVRKGGCASSDVIVSGSGKTNMETFVSNSSKVNISGSGDVKVNPRQSLDVRISGSGSVYYRGLPTVTSQISGSGKIIKL
ncbi:DUF2807 domain-containing protein [Segetibacter sp. 3557_3]|uniref:head GIN domain-containing protein n=1 Tax=Segetibacter sp. 3557_3 TaxID=2547429 RepID=UPI001058AB9D|nr:head GIN domain-containing protein [Segetibacter sp. 3557_3]TDH29052.1 DUF2807 domain-containing protein [Segetibacter sp. 3557_3]